MGSNTVIRQPHLAHQDWPSSEGQAHWAERLEDKVGHALPPAVGSQEAPDTRSVGLGEEGQGQEDLANDLYQQILGEPAAAEDLEFYTGIPGRDDSSSVEPAIGLLNVASAASDTNANEHVRSSVNAMLETLPAAGTAGPKEEKAPSTGGGGGKEDADQPGTLVIDESGTLDASTFEGKLENVDTLHFTSNVTADANDFSEVSDIVLEDGATLINLGNEQTVTALAGSLDGEGEPLVLREAGDEAVNIVTDFSGPGGHIDSEETLELVVEPTTEELEAPYNYEFGTLTLSGNGAVNYDNTGRGFKEIDASSLTGDLTYSGQTFVNETITLGEGADTLNMAGDSNVHTADQVIGFDASEDTLDVISGEFGEVEVIEPEVETWDRDALWDAIDEALIVSREHDGAYVAFETDDSTRILADTESPSDPRVTSEGDFEIELLGTKGLTDILASEGLLS